MGGRGIGGTAFGVGGGVGVRDGAVVENGKEVVLCRYKQARGIVLVTVVIGVICGSVVGSVVAVGGVIDSVALVGGVVGSRWCGW